MNTFMKQSAVRLSGIIIGILGVCIYGVMCYGLLYPPHPPCPAQRQKFSPPLVTYWSALATHQIAALHPDLPLPSHTFFVVTRHAARQATDHALKRQINAYVANKQTLVYALASARPYLSYVSNILRARHLPYELALLPFIESGYNPFARSPTGAAGLWQMMPGTALALGVPINAHYDGRRDLIISTQAALQYLQYLHHNLHHDWVQAIAAYNVGEKMIQRVVAHTAKQPARWLSHVPHETQSYVIRLRALIYVLDHAKAYHITLPVIPAQPPFTFLFTTGRINLRDIAYQRHLSFPLVRALNAGFRHNVTQSGVKTKLLLPLVDRL